MEPQETLADPSWYVASWGSSLNSQVLVFLSDIQGSRVSGTSSATMVRMKITGSQVHCQTRLSTRDQSQPLLWAALVPGWADTNLHRLLWPCCFHLFCGRGDRCVKQLLGEWVMAWAPGHPLVRNTPCCLLMYTIDERHIHWRSGTLVQKGPQKTGSP
jgi:hypothetical protein